MTSTNKNLLHKKSTVPLIEEYPTDIVWGYVNPVLGSLLLYNISDSDKIELHYLKSVNENRIYKKNLYTAKKDFFFYENLYEQKKEQTVQKQLENGYVSDDYSDSEWENEDADYDADADYDVDYDDYEDDADEHQKPLDKEEENYKQILIDLNTRIQYYHDKLNENHYSSVHLNGTTIVFNNDKPFQIAGPTARKATSGQRTNFCAQINLVLAPLLVFYVFLFFH